MRPTALALVPLALVLLAVGPAAAFPEGGFAARDGASEVRVVRPEAGRIDLTVTAPFLRATVDATLVHDPETGLWHQPERSRGWLARLMGSRPPALPFQGNRLVFAREEDDTLVATTLEVNERGRPTLVRLAVAPDDDGASLEIRRFGEAGVQTSAPLRLERVEP